jgi:hypothetical protein
LENQVPKFNFILAAFIVLNSLSSFGQVVRAGPSSLSDYNQYVARVQGLSFVEVYERVRQQANSAYEMADPDEFIQLLHKVPMNDITREIWMSQLLKNSPESERVNSLLLLDSNLEKTFNRKPKKPIADNIKSKIQQWKRERNADSLLFVDGLNIEQSNFVTDTEHQFTFVSNTDVPVIYYGMWNEFLKMSLVPFVKGECKNPTVMGTDYWQQAYYSDECIFSKDLPTMPEIPSQPEQKTSWLLPVVVGLGAALLYGLKDKRVTFKSPSFKF